MASFIRRHLNFLIGLLISGVAVYLSLRKIDFSALWESLRSIQVLFLFPAVAMQISCFFLKGAGWRYLLMPAKKEIRFTSAISVLVIGLMVNNLFPAKMGELARAYLMGEKEKLPKSLCLSTVGVEHLLDVVVLLIFLLVLLPTVSLPDWLRVTGTLVGFAALGMIVLIFLVMRREEKFLEWLSRILKYLPERFRQKIQSVLNHFFQGFRVLTGRYIFYAFGMLVPMWIMSFLFAYFMMGTCGLSLPFKAAVMVVIFVAFGKIIPSSPGAIGTYHYLVILVLTSFQISKEAALGYAIILHALSYLVEVVAGIVGLFAANLSLGSFTRRTGEPL